MTRVKKITDPVVIAETRLTIAPGVITNNRKLTKNKDLRYKMLNHLSTILQPSPEIHYGKLASAILKKSVLLKKSVNH